MKKLFIILLIVPILASPAYAALFQSGFETGSNAPAAGFQTLFAGSTAIDGWSVSSGSIDWIGSYWQPGPPDGLRSIDLAGNGAGTITTSFATTPGKQYTVTFSLSGNYDGNTEKLTRTALVSVDGGTPQTFVFEKPNGWSRENMGWIQQAYSFTAAGATTSLTFSSGEGTSPYGAALDNVNVVPLPGAVWLLGAGLIGLAGIRRRMK